MVGDIPYDFPPRRLLAFSPDLCETRLTRRSGTLRRRNQALRVGTQVPAGSHVQQQNALKRRMREKRFLSAHTVMTAGKLRIVFMGTPISRRRFYGPWRPGKAEKCCRLCPAGSPCRAWTQAQGAGCQGHGAGTGHSCPSAAELPGTGGSGRTAARSPMCWWWRPTG